ncbi:hypothetical protein L9F63_002254, partial [Diploptera punctata]
YILNLERRKWLRAVKVRVTVLFHPEDDHLQFIAFRYALRHINADNELLPGTQLRPLVINTTQTDSFGIGKKVCNVAREGVAAIFGPRDPTATGIVQSISETLEIPNMQTYAEVPEYPSRCLFNLHPTLETISKAIASVVTDYLNWGTFTILYESDEGLIKLQDVLKAHGPDDDAITVLQFLPGDDQRQLLKEIRASRETHILLECSTERIIDILKQAREVKMVGDYISYFITSLDTHTLDLSDFKSHTNLTAIRLVDPENPVVKSVVNIWSDWEPFYGRPFTMTPETVKTEMALTHDAVFLFARALHNLFTPEDKFSVSPLACDDVDKWPHGFRLSSFMQVMEMEGMTGTIRFDEFGRRSDVKLDILEYFDGQFKKVAWWQTGHNITHTLTETEKDAEMAKTMQAKIFIVSSRIGVPFLTEKKGENLKGNDRYEGYSMDLITEIAKLLGFSFEFRLVPNNLHGELVTDLQNRRADLAICDLTITEIRKQLIDFTMPFMNLGISILYSKPVEKEPRLFAFMDPFSIDVWIYVATAYLGVSILLFILSRIAPGEWDNPHPCNPDPGELENTFNLLNCLWFSIGSLMGQGCDLLPKAVSTRMVASVWWFFALIMISSYTANLAAFLTLNRLESTISNAEDLAKQYKIKYGTMHGGSTHSFFKNSNDSTYKRMYTVMSQTRPSVFMKDNDEGVDRVRKEKGKYAFFMESITIEYHVERKCDLMQVGGLLDSKGYGIGLPLNSPFRTKISGAVLKLQEKGILEELKARWWKVSDGVSCSALEAESAKADSNELGLDNVGGVFVVLIAGTLAAFFMAILELLWNCRKIAVEERISPWEALTSELKFVVNCANENKPVRKKEEDEEETSPQNGFQKLDDKE